jgi:hypothetical protein
MTMHNTHRWAQSSNIEHPFARLGSSLDIPSNTVQNQKKIEPHLPIMEAKYITKDNYILTMIREIS